MQDYSYRPRKSLLLDVPIAGRCAWIALQRCRIHASGHGLVLEFAESTDFSFEQNTSENEPHTTRVDLPAGAFASILLEPGTLISHEAVKRCAESNTRLIWVGEESSRLYAVGDGRHDHKRLLAQAQLLGNGLLSRRVAAARRLYGLMFEEPAPPSFSIEKLRGLEGSKVRQWYANVSSELNIEWNGKAFVKASNTDEINKVLNWANACIYACAEIAICVLGYSASLGVVHQGDPRSFVFDLSDTVKFRLVLKPVLSWYAENKASDFNSVRRFCRDHFASIRLLDELIRAADHVILGEDGSCQC